MASRPRRFVALANPGLRELVTRAIGDRWVAQLEELRRLEASWATRRSSRNWRAAKRANKDAAGRYLRRQTGVELDPDWLCSTSR